MKKGKQTLRQELHSRKLKRPPSFIYPLLANVWRLLYVKKLGVTFDYRIDVKKIKGPFIVVSNHASRLDYIYTGIAFLPHRMNYVAGYNEFFRSHLRGIFRLLQVIPKKNFVADVNTIKQISRIVTLGGSVMLFPEGMSSISGSNQPSAIGSGKLLKHFGIPVYMTRISGGYLTSTKYCLDERPGRVDVIIDKLFTPEQLSAMDADEIQHAVDRAIANDDYEWNKSARASYRGGGSMAKNMHTLLYKCPRCGNEFTMRGEGDRLFCESCGNGATLTEKYELIPFDNECVIPETPRVWFDMQRESVKHELADPDFFMTENVKIGVLPEYEPLKHQTTSKLAGEGVLRLDHAGLHFSGSRWGKPFAFTLKPEHLPTFGMCTDVSRFYTFVGGDFIEFYPERTTTEKWFLATEENHRLAGGKWRDFV